MCVYVEACVQPCCDMCDILIEEFNMETLVQLNSLVALKEILMRLLVTLCCTHSTSLVLSNSINNGLSIYINMTA